MEDYIINTTNHEDIDFNELDRVIKFACKHLKVNNPMLNIVIVDKERIQEINREYRNKDAVTDVISFAFEEVDDVEYDNIRFLGEIYICYDRCVEQAKEYGHSVERELAYMVVHGFYHVMGYDHIKEEDKVIMRPKEENILNKLNITRD